MICSGFRDAGLESPAGTFRHLTIRKAGAMVDPQTLDNHDGPVRS